MSEKYDCGDIILACLAGLIMGAMLASIVLDSSVFGRKSVSEYFLDSVCKDKLGIDNVEYSGTSGTNIYCKEIIPTIENAKQLDGTDSYVILEGRK